MALLRAAVVLALMLAVLCPGLAAAQSLEARIAEACKPCVSRMATQSGIYILEKGEESLVGRAWLAGHAQESIDIQYFIWSTDNVGILAAEQLLRAADRGVSVRVLVDDLLIDAEDETLLLLSAHPNAAIRVYNPNLTVGVGFWQRLKNVFGDFRAINQRMHDKTAIFDGIAGVTGGRNMADEYFDFDHDYNFRDRDVLILGAAVRDMQVNFDEFWNSNLAVPVEDIFKDEVKAISPADVERRAGELRAYADDPGNFAPEVRQAIAATENHFPRLVQEIVWDDVEFISDIPGKNEGAAGLGGSGESTDKLINAVKNARSTILIQSPYLILPEGGIDLFHTLIRQGVRIRISTNSLASTDNIQAFAGYSAQRKDLLRAGVELYEFKPHPAIKEQLIENYPRIAENDPIFALHAKSMVIDDELVFIGTFNLDPRSANLNTEVGVLVRNRELARQLKDSIELDIDPGNSWRTTGFFNPDAEVGRGKRIRVWFNSLLPMEPIL
jgi:putative cardiolipin synthase